MLNYDAIIPNNEFSINLDEIVEETDDPYEEEYPDTDESPVTP